LFPNLLISLHPDYVMTHTLRPLAADRTFVECSWAFPREVADRPGFDPSYAVDFWDITNREDWLACEAVTRGLASSKIRQGPFAWSEDEVHIFMAMVAQGYVDGRAGRPRRSTSKTPQLSERLPASWADLGSTGVLVSLRA
jgi:Rieske 2Fe-2S family protein